MSKILNPRAVLSDEEGWICMPDHYNPKLFLPQISNNLLREFFTRRDERTDFDWSAPKETDADPLLNARRALHLPQQADIERWFRTAKPLSPSRSRQSVLRKRLPRKPGASSPALNFWLLKVS